MMMDANRIAELKDIYRKTLLEDILPFWLDHGLDQEHGGFITSLDREGNVVDDDKSIWFQGRATWTFATACSEIEFRQDWIHAARSSLHFLRNYGFDHHGHMFFLVTRDGKPLRKRRYIFSELFTIMALVAYSRVTGKPQFMNESVDLFDKMVDRLSSPLAIEPKVNPTTRPMRSFSIPMMLMGAAQELRLAAPEEEQVLHAKCERMIDLYIDEIRRYFLHPELEAVLETTDPEGRLIDHFDGRTLNPGHAIEGAWFILREALHRGNDAELITLGTQMLDWMWRRGWDEKYGGILYFTDVRGLPVQEYWHDMKFWWPQTEALLATLMAYRLTEDEKYARWHRMAHDYLFEHFPDPEYGEWFGYLHRDGRLSNPSKGTQWKGPFHIPRMLLFANKLLEEMS